MDRAYANQIHPEYYVMSTAGEGELVRPYGMWRTGLKKRSGALSSGSTFR